MPRATARSAPSSPRRADVPTGVTTGRVGVGGVEIIGYDPATGQYRTSFYDSQGNTSAQTLTHRAGDWIWEGPHARCTGEMTGGGRTMIARHERSNDGTWWAPSMTVTLRRVD